MGIRVKPCSLAYNCPALQWFGVARQANLRMFRWHLIVTW